MQQLSLQAGLKKHGKKGEEAVIAELEQQHLRDSFQPILPSKLTKEERNKVLESIMLIEEKKDGRVKGWNVADGRKQCEFIQKGTATSPTVKLESIF